MNPIIPCFILAVVLISACGNTPTTGTLEDHINIAPTTERHIDRQTFSETWPFTVDSGVVKCVQYDVQGVDPNVMRGVVFEANGITYSVNGTSTSRSKEFGYRPFQEIWAIDTAATNEAIREGVPKDEAQMMVRIGPAIDLGLSLCK